VRIQAYRRRLDYGNEKEAGEGINRALAEGIVKREELCVLSKLWNTFHDPDKVELACRKTLEDLKLDYLDIYLIHFPIHLKFVPIEKRYPPEWNHDPDVEEDNRMIPIWTVTYQQTYQAMEALSTRDSSKISDAQTSEPCSSAKCCYAKHKPSILQVEMHPFCTQQLLKRVANELDVQVMAYSNLGAASYVQLGLATEADSCLTPQVVKDIAAAHGKSAGQIVLKWGVQRGTTIIPKTEKVSRLEENASLFDFDLTEE